MTPEFFYSDPHFHHANIVKLADRPFVDVDEMNAELVRRYRAVVGEEDTVLWLGDCGFRPMLLAEVLAQLPGRKWLIRGNHDEKPQRMAKLGFDLVTDSMWLPFEGRSVLACHYPPSSAQYPGDERHDRYAGCRPEFVKGRVYMHGHTHERIRSERNRIHVGVDAWAYAPVSRAEVEGLLAQM